MSIIEAELLLKQEIEAFRSEVIGFVEIHGVGETYFGMASARNPKLVSRLRGGAGVTTSTIKKVRAYMDEFKRRKAGLAVKSQGSA